jgi:hypothetical protein
VWHLASGLKKLTFSQNFISAASVREITSLRQDFLSSLADLGFVPFSASPDSPNLNVNSANPNVVKAVILGGLWPRVARVHLPSSAIKFDKVQAGTVQRENTAKEYKIYDLKNGRVFLHPLLCLTVYSAAHTSRQFCNIHYFHNFFCLSPSNNTLQY